MDFDTSFDEPEDNDDYDEFFFQSIRRYNTLQMFHLENIPHHLLQIDDVSLCVASKRSKGENSELLKLKLPAKLTLPPEEEGRSKENDFKVLSGIYTGNLVYQLDKLDRTDKLITSEYNVNGLSIYSISVSSLGNKNEEQRLDVIPWVGADFAVIQESTSVICSKCCHEPLIQADVLVGHKVKEIKHPFNCGLVSQDWPSKDDLCCVNNNIKCKPLSVDSVAVLNTQSGEVVLHDLRSKDSFVSLSKNKTKLSKEIWTLSGCDYRESSLDYFGILSNAASFCIYDKRKNSILIQNTGQKDPKENFGRLKLKFNNKSDKFSISGLNALVDIFQLSGNNFEHVFTHNGHCPRNLPTSLATDHIWLQAGGKEYIVSICDNKTLNCWDYKVCRNNK